VSNKVSPFNLILSISKPFDEIIIADVGFDVITLRMPFVGLG
jgi:hypothetical protein